MVADVRRVTEQLVARLEEMIRAHPDQWHMPHAIWTDEPAAGPMPADGGALPHPNRRVTLRR